MNTFDIHGGPYARSKKAANYADLPLSTFHSFVARGLLPKGIKIGPKVTVFSLPAIDAALAALREAGQA